MTLQQIRTHIQDSFSDLTFEEERHLYKVNGVIFPSVSSKVESHAEKFDENYWLPRCARKEGVTEHELKHKWQTTNIEACELGHNTHSFLETYSGLETPKSPQEKAGIDYFKELIKEYEVVHREVRMYSKRWGYAGTADLLLRHIKTGNLVLADYKTNKDLFKTYGFLKSPFDTLESHPYNKYQIQLSYYQMMLEEIGLSITDRFLVYLKADATYKIYPLLDFTEYLIDHLGNQKREKDLGNKW